MLKYKKKKNGKEKRNGSNKGFYVALTICIVAVGAACYSTYGSIKEYVNPTNNISSNSSQTSQSSEKGSDKEVDLNLSGILENTSKSDTDTEENKRSAESDSDNKSSKNTDTDSEKTESILLSSTYLYPVGQKITKEYSGENLVYSKTMGDWRVHLGTDFAAEKGTKVKPMTTGVVKEIYTDGLLGLTIVIDHGNGVTAYYSGLSNGTLVNVGDSVGVGDYIGSIGSVPSETLEDSHLHLGVKKNDEWINPTELLSNQHE